MGCGSTKILHGSGQPSVGEDGREVYSRGSSRKEKDKTKGKKKGRRFGRNESGDNNKFRRSQSQPAFSGSASSPTGLENYQTTVAIKGNSRIRVTLSCDGSMLEIETERLSITEQPSPEASTSQPYNNDTYQSVVQDLSYSSDSPTTSGHGALGLEARVSDHGDGGIVPRHCWESTEGSLQPDSVIVCNKCGNSANMDVTDSIPLLPPFPEAQNMSVSKSSSFPDKSLSELSHSDSCHCDLCLPGLANGAGLRNDMTPPDVPAPSLPMENINLDSSGCASPDYVNTKTILLRCTRCGNPIQKQKVVQAGLPRQHEVTAELEWSGYRAGETRSMAASAGAARGSGSLTREGGGVGVWAEGWGKGKINRPSRNKTAPVGELGRIAPFGSDDIGPCDNLDELQCMSFPRANNNANHHSSTMMVTSRSLPNAIVNLPNGDINGVQVKPPPRIDSLRCNYKPPPGPADPSRRSAPHANGFVKEPRPPPKRTKGKLWLRKAHSENDAEVTLGSLPNGNHNPGSSAKVFRSLDHGPNGCNGHDGPGMHRTFSTMSSLSTQETILSRTSSASSVSSFSSRKWRKKIGENTKDQIVEVGLMMSNPVKHLVEYDIFEKSIQEQEIDECFEEYNNFVYPEAIMDALEAQLVEIHVHEDFFNDFPDLYDDEDLDS